MDFTPIRRPARSDSIVPMINVVFLLLIFFLMSAKISPPAAFKVTPPLTSTGTPAGQQDILLLAADGRLGFGAYQGDAALAALAQRATPGKALLIRADANTPAVKLAALLSRLAGLGITNVAIGMTAR